MYSIAEGIGNAFDVELKNFLNQMKPIENIPSNFTTFYNKQY